MWILRALGVKENISEANRSNKEKPYSVLDRQTDRGATVPSFVKGLRYRSHLVHSRNSDKKSPTGSTKLHICTRCPKERVFEFRLQILKTS